MLQNATSQTQFVSDTCCPQRVLIVDESELVQAGMRAVLAKQPWVDSSYSLGSFDQVTEVIQRKKPHILLLSTSVEGVSGLKFCKELRERFPLLKIVLMSNQGCISMSLAQSHGANGFLPLQSPILTINAVLERVAEGKNVFPRGTTSETNVVLSQREKEVLQQIVTGLSNPEVASVLNVSRHTVKQHASELYRKLGVRNRAQAAARAHELGLVS